VVLSAIFSIMSGRVIRSFKHLKHQNLSIISDVVVKILGFLNSLLSTYSSMSRKHISKATDYSQILKCAHISDARSNYFLQEGHKPYYK